VGIEVNGVIVVMHLVACVEVIHRVVEVVREAAPAAALGYAKVQDCRDALIECVVVLALRDGCSFSDNGYLSLLIFGTGVGRRLLA